MFRGRGTQVHNLNKQIYTIKKCSQLNNKQVKLVFQD